MKRQFISVMILGLILVSAVTAPGYNLGVKFFSKEEKMQIDACERTTGWSGGTSITNLVTTTEHVQGKRSLSFGRTTNGGTVDVSIEKEISPAGYKIDAAECALVFQLYLASYTNIDKFNVDLGTSTNHYARYIVDDSDLAVGWQELFISMISVSSQIGNGMDSERVKWLRFVIACDTNTNTLTGVRIDDIVWHYSNCDDESAAILASIDSKIPVDPSSESGMLASIKTNTDNIPPLGQTNMAQSVPVTLASNHSLIEINVVSNRIGLAKEAGGNLTIIAGDTTSIDGKIPADPAKESGQLASIKTNTDNIDASTVSIDGKFPAVLGQTNMAESLSVTIASNHSLIEMNIVSNRIGLAKEAGGNLTIIAGDTTSIDGKIPADPAKESGNLASINSNTDGIADISLTTDGRVRTSRNNLCFYTNLVGGESATEIFTPSGGKKLRIIQIYVSTASTGTNVILQFTTSDLPFFVLYTANKATATGNVVCAVGDTNEGVEVTCGAGTFVSIAYDEID